ILYIRDLIGSGIYRQLQSDIVNSTLSGYNQTLLYDYIKPALVKYTLSMLPYKVTYQMTNKGYQKFKSDTSEAAENKTLDIIGNQDLQIAQRLGEDIVAYLRQNHLRFPLYDNP